MKRLDLNWGRLFFGGLWEATCWYMTQQVKRLLSKIKNKYRLSFSGKKIFCRKLSTSVYIKIYFMLSNIYDTLLMQDNNTSFFDDLTFSLFACNLSNKLASIYVRAKIFWVSWEWSHNVELVNVWICFQSPNSF